SGFHLRRAARWRSEADHCAGNQGRPARQPRHGVQARGAGVPLGPCRMGRGNSGRRAGTGQQRRDRGRHLDPDERMEGETARVSLTARYWGGVWNLIRHCHSRTTLPVSGRKRSASMPIAPAFFSTIWPCWRATVMRRAPVRPFRSSTGRSSPRSTACRKRSEEHTSELQSRENLVCRLLLEKKKKKIKTNTGKELEYIHI